MGPKGILAMLVVFGCTVLFTQHDLESRSSPATPQVVPADARTATPYLGDEACRECHADYYDDYIRSGHPYKLTRTAGMEPSTDTWPWTAVPPLAPEVTGWQDVEYVIGNFFWKARFIGRDGFIVTGDTAQYNLATGTRSAYHTGEQKPYDCGKCHTTGYSPAGNQLGLPGLVGTWAQDGVRCEACHGPGGPHDGDLSGAKACADCHFRDTAFRMPWSGGFTRHHQQSEDLAHSAHNESLTCETCHDSHRSVVFNDGGTTKLCTTCHAGTRENGYYTVANMESVECIDCHMPFMGKSAVKHNAYTGDVRGHLFRITTQPTAAADNTYKVNGTTFWNQDANGESSVTLDYACIGCHLEVAPDALQIGVPMGSDAASLQIASAYARDIHNRHPGTPRPREYTSGGIENLSGYCPEVSFAIGSFRVTTHATTAFQIAECRELANGTVVDVGGTRRSDGTLLATEVEATPRR